MNDIAIVQNSEGVTKLDFDRIKGIISSYYKLYGNDKRIWDISFDWRKDDLKDITLHRPMRSTSIQMYSAVYRLFDDIEALKNNYRNVVSEVFKDAVNVNSFDLICKLVKKIAFYCYNYDLIDSYTFKLLINMSKDRLISKSTTQGEASFISSEERNLALNTLTSFYNYVKFGYPQYINSASTMLLKFYLSNLGLRISSINSIEKTDLKGDRLFFKVFKKANSDGFEWCEYHRDFIGNDMFNMLISLSKETGDTKLLPPIENPVIITLFIKQMKRERCYDVLQGWEVYKKWRKNTHSGRHGFINYAHDAGLSNDTISSITLQNVSTIEKYYTKKRTILKKREAACNLLVQKGLHIIGNVKISY